MFAKGLIAVICSFYTMRSERGDMGCTFGVVK